MRWAATMLAVGALSLGSCMGSATPPDAEAPPAPGMDGQCDNAALNGFTGQKATAEVGAAILKASGAKVIRWVPPGSAVTMDFRADRLTVSYDAAMVITRASCG